MSVLVATRGRPAQLRDCLESILLSSHDAFEVIVVEQSRELTTLAVDPRVRRLHAVSSGKSAALNEGLSLVRSPIVAFTDDDCIVPPDWLDKGEASLLEHPEISLVFGDLAAVEHDPTQCFAPTAHFAKFRIVEGTRAAASRGGAGADMFARRRLFDTIGAFDETIGPGTRFHACEEFDIYYRALAAGEKVAFAPDLSVVHVGIRPYANGQARMLLRRYALGEGAVIAKHLRLRDSNIVRPGAEILAEDLQEIVRNLRRRRLTGIGTFGYKCWGLLSGLVTPVDHRRRVYRAQSQTR